MPAAALQPLHVAAAQEEGESAAERRDVARGSHRIRRGRGAEGGGAPLPSELRGPPASLLQPLPMGMVPWHPWQCEMHGTLTTAQTLLCPAFHDAACQSPPYLNAMLTCCLTGIEPPQQLPQVSGEEHVLEAQPPAAQHDPGRRRKRRHPIKDFHQERSHQGCEGSWTAAEHG